MIKYICFDSFYRYLVLMPNNEARNVLYNILYFVDNFSNRYQNLSKISIYNSSHLSVIYIYNVYSDSRISDFVISYHFSTQGIRSTEM